MINWSYFEFFSWILAQYLTLSFLFFVGFYFIFAKKFEGRKVRSSAPALSDILREITLSCLTIAIFALVGKLTFGDSSFLAETKFYTEIRQYGFPYFVLIFPVMLVFHDTYFYWIHRLLHQKHLFNLIHRTHHLSINPTPFASYAFHPFEAFIQSGMLVVLIFLLPTHPIHIVGLFSIMILYNAYGHLGYEIYTSSSMGSRGGRWLNTATYHNLHHSKYEANFSLYFTFWDYLMKTKKID